MSNKLEKFIFFRNDFNNENKFFSNPISEIICNDPTQLDDCFKQLEDANKNGYWLAGYFSYELGFLLDECLIDYLPKQRNIPFMHFGVFNQPSNAMPNYENGNFTLNNIQPSLTLAQYTEKFTKLHDHLKNGDSFQGNLTFPFTAEWAGDPWAAFLQLAAKQPVAHSSFCSLGGETILSRSPELFFKIDKDRWIETHPMKGTSPRGKTKEEDEKLIEILINDPKTLAENVMIVDLLRNDISIISEPSTMHVPELFKLETYNTLHQMVSHVKARVREKISFKEILKALFPCGSITGAPKIRTMQILQQLEENPRDIYCGSLGFISPDQEFYFNVAIRTISLYQNNKAVLNAGGGIVYDSTAESEYKEALLKISYSKNLEDIR